MVRAPLVFLSLSVCPTSSPGSNANTLVFVSFSFVLAHRFHPCSNTNGSRLATVHHRWCCWDHPFRRHPVLLPPSCTAAQAACQGAPFEAVRGWTHPCKPPLEAHRSRKSLRNRGTSKVLIDEAVESRQFGASWKSLGRNWAWMLKGLGCMSEVVQGVNVRVTPGCKLEVEGRPCRRSIRWTTSEEPPHVGSQGLTLS